MTEASPEYHELYRVFGDKSFNRRRGLRAMGRLVSEQHGPRVLAGDAASMCREATMQEAKAQRTGRGGR